MDRSPIINMSCAFSIFFWLIYCMGVHCISLLKSRIKWSLAKQLIDANSSMPIFRLIFSRICRTTLAIRLSTISCLKQAPDLDGFHHPGNRNTLKIRHDCLLVKT